MKTRNTPFRLTTPILSIVFFALFPFVSVGQQSDLFTRTDALVEAADAADAALLSPDNYGRAMSAYGKAKDFASRGRADKAARELEDVDAALTEAIEASKLGKVRFAVALETRDKALAADAPRYEPDLWQRAEEQFESAARALEDGNVNRATYRARKAMGDYSEAELEAIKTGIVGEARRLIAAAEDGKVDREAPESLNKARALARQAEASLDRQRYATDAPIALAAEAEYEARHAEYLARQIRRIDDKDVTTEQLLLEWEKPFQNVALALDVTTDLSGGFAKAEAAAVAMAENLTAQNATMTTRIAELETKLGGTERIAEESQRLQRQLAQVEALFSPSQAEVVRVGNDLVLRLVGLSFPTGQSVIQTHYYGLLRNVQRAIEVFPDAPIGIEGHTDSVGADAANMKLSQDRAESVREYLIANLGLPESRVAATGYGKSRPIASNETEQGRATNRRIDVVMKNVRARQTGG